MRRINVLHFITPSGFYGAEMWILALARYLDAQRINCHLCVTRESDSQDLTLHDRFRALGLKASQISMKGRFDPRGLKGLLRLIGAERIDIIHTHGYKSDILGLIAARLSGKKALATPHGFENSPDLKLRFFIRMGCQALRHFDKVAPLSDALEADMHRLKVPSQRIRLIRNGVDLEEIFSEAGKSMGFPWIHSPEKKIGYVGQIAHRKNIGDMIRAFDLLHGELRSVRLLIVGDGPMRPTLEQMAHSLKSGSDIEFLGYRSDRLRIVRECDIFCMTSSLEGIPRCMMEAMALEKPVVAFDIPGVDKLILHERTGLLAPFGDIQRLKECLKKLLLDRSLADRLARNGMNHVIANFSAERMAEEYMNLYGEMAAQRA